MFPWTLSQVVFRCNFSQGFFQALLRKYFIPCALAQALFPCGRSHGAFSCALLQGLSPCALLQELFLFALFQHPSFEFFRRCFFCALFRKVFPALFRWGFSVRSSANVCRARIFRKFPVRQLAGILEAPFWRSFISALFRRGFFRTRAFALAPLLDLFLFALLQQFLCELLPRCLFALFCGFFPCVLSREPFRWGLLMGLFCSLFRRSLFRALFCKSSFCAVFSRTFSRALFNKKLYNECFRRFFLRALSQGFYSAPLRRAFQRAFCQSVFPSALPHGLFSVRSFSGEFPCATLQGL